MPGQHVNAHIAILGCVCLGLLAYLPTLDGTPAPPPAAQAGAAPDFNDPASPTVVVNKRRPLAEPGYSPADLTAAGTVTLRSEAAAAWHSMAADAAAAGVQITTVSGYRSASDQAGIHSTYEAAFGPQTAETLSAWAGYSEHQTGLAIDIGNPDGACALQACFDSTAAGSWAAANAHRYGFIIRYPAGAEAVTGYTYEPWHLRWVGAGTAAAMHSSGVTLEEYAGLPAAPGR